MLNILLEVSWPAKLTQKEDSQFIKKKSIKREAFRNTSATNF